MAAKEVEVDCTLNWTKLMRKMNFHFKIRGLDMEVFQSYTKIKIKVIPVGLQIHTICNWHCSGQMVNLLQLFFPKNWLLSWFSFRQIICFLKPWKEFSVLYFSYLSYQCPMSSIGMVSEKPSMNVQLVKSIFFFSLSPPPPSMPPLPPYPSSFCLSF